MSEASAHPTFDRVLGRLDLLLFSVCAILTIDSLATAASMGVSWFSWWIITMVVFFVPYGLVTAELGSAWPGEGGVYLWVREGLGHRFGAMTAWIYWINNAYWIPAVYLVFAGTFHSIFLKGRLGPAFDGGAGATWLEAFIAIALTWLTVGLGVVRLEVSKWVPNVGAVVKVAIFLGLGALGFQFLLGGRTPANEFSLAAFLPRWSDSLAFLPILLYNTLGFELMSSAGEEMKEPQRDVPRVVLLQRRDDEHGQRDDARQQRDTVADAARYLLPDRRGEFLGHGLASPGTAPRLVRQNLLRTAILEGPGRFVNQPGRPCGSCGNSGALRIAAPRPTPVTFW